MPQTKLGQLIKEHRKKQGFTQVELAEKVGVAANYISLLERGERENPDVEYVDRLARALEANINEFRRAANYAAKVIDAATQADFEKSIFFDLYETFRSLPDHLKIRHRRILVKFNEVMKEDRDDMDDKSMSRK